MEHVTCVPYKKFCRATLCKEMGMCPLSCSDHSVVSSWRVWQKDPDCRVISSACWNAGVCESYNSGKDTLNCRYVVSHIYVQYTQSTFVVSHNTAKAVVRSLRGNEPNRAIHTGILQVFSRAALSCEFGNLRDTQNQQVRNETFL